MHKLNTKQRNANIQNTQNLKTHTNFTCIPCLQYFLTQVGDKALLTSASDYGKFLEFCMLRVVAAVFQPDSVSPNQVWHPSCKNSFPRMGSCRLLGKDKLVLVRIKSGKTSVVKQLQCYK
ncbi:hypothetical protein ACF0H5_008075 [Mactra antiquata]